MTKAGEKMELSTLPKTWIFDLDGTLFRHNGYLTKEGDRALPKAKDYLSGIPDSDFILIMTARPESLRDETEAVLKANGIRYDGILFDLPVGERILVNDRKPSGLDMSIAINIDRDAFELPEIVRNK